MVIAMTKGYSEQTAGAKLCIDLASDWASECIADLKLNGNIVLMDYGAADGGTASDFWAKSIQRFHKPSLDIFGSVKFNIPKLE